MKTCKDNIFTFLRTILMVFGLVCMLSACQTEKGDVSAMDGELTGEESDLDEQQRSCWQAEILESSSAFLKAPTTSIVQNESVASGELRELDKLL